MTPTSAGTCRCPVEHLRRLAACLGTGPGHGLARPRRIVRLVRRGRGRPGRALPRAERPRSAAGGASAPGRRSRSGPGTCTTWRTAAKDSSISIHAYSPPLVAMTYYQKTVYGLMARETVAIDGPEGTRGRGGHDTALADATASVAGLTCERPPGRCARHRRTDRRGAQRPGAAAAGGGPGGSDRWRGTRRHPAARAADR